MSRTVSKTIEDEFLEGKDPKKFPRIEDLENMREDMKSKSLKSYSFATHKADKNLISAHPVRLSIALNFSVFTYECLNDRDQAKKNA
mmetsp:Transcript_15727/g.24163  ORF Transcript_15727/g.24163 Transcript_15727/m.24163 type:complete len:87 (-) Transcript_15727:180-440(-)|eukprot:CAMPEP_0170499630 /NCGR_PEP_ID=MMETSP0208-20121228/32041_1 /TAXON_ID=197538 /ORGANISM="Strombidium inclinatum, Strain S3" /LENGTH=86 /DNA_ID=CAMNT_0010777265 /DNA_START=685 /DNA_END=945 /DNA_ORIENTATION=+